MKVGLLLEVSSELYARYQLTGGFAYSRLIRMLRLLRRHFEPKRKGVISF